MYFLTAYWYFKWFNTNIISSIQKSDMLAQPDLHKLNEIVHEKQLEHLVISTLTMHQLYHDR